MYKSDLLFWSKSKFQNDLRQAWGISCQITSCLWNQQLRKESSCDKPTVNKRPSDTVNKRQTAWERGMYFSSRTMEDLGMRWGEKWDLYTFSMLTQFDNTEKQDISTIMTASNESYSNISKHKELFKTNQKWKSYQFHDTAKLD